MGEIGIGTAVDALTDLSSLFAEINAELDTVVPLGDTSGLPQIPIGSAPEVGVATPVGLGIHWLPSIDVDTPYTGATDVPAWSDVFGWAVAVANGEIGVGSTATPASTAHVTKAVHTAMGTTIKALSGFINHAVAQEVQDVRSLFQVDVWVASAANVTARAQAARIAVLEAQMNAVLTLAIPSLQAQVVKAEHDAFQLALNAVTLSNKWAVDNVLRPLETQRAADVANTTAQIKSSAHATLTTALASDAAVAAAAAGALAPVASAVKTLLAENEACVKPMCDLLGPKSPLGNLLKGLKIAALLALLAEIANLDEAGLEHLISALVSISGGIIGDFETMFVGGAGTLGQVATTAAGQVGADLNG